MRGAGKSDALVVGNIFRELPGGSGDSAVVVATAEEGNHEAAGVTGTRVVDHRLGAVADFDAVFAVVGRNEKKDAFAGFFGADAELFVEVRGISFDIVAIKGFHGDDGHLGAGFLLELQA